ncbi:MAG TPA: SGNH/GDSL hydrolase family protein [Opitutaceae bacterium]|nr:SGNH/GDSL hydrolase family protein [Opitutaceae bacterium]
MIEPNRVPPTDPRSAPTPNASHNVRRLTRGIVAAMIVTVWGALLVALGGFLVVYEIYLDLKAPDRPHWISGTPAEYIAQSIYVWHYRSLWQGRPDCSEFDAALVVVPKPGTARFQGAEFDTVIHVSPSRVRTQPPAKPAAPLVVMAGDSYTFGWGVNDDETYSWLLQEDYGYHTVNTGVPGYGTPGELLRLRRMGLLTKIDALVIQFCDNDWPVNQGFVRAPFRSPTAREAQSSWDELLAYHRQPVTYFNVLADVARYVRIESRGIHRIDALRSLLTTRPPPFGTSFKHRYYVTGETMAKDFVGVLDQFPELKRLPIIVFELVPNNGATGFTAALRSYTKDHPNVIPFSLQLRPGDFYRFDGHLTPHGQRAVAVQLAGALSQLFATHPATPGLAAAHPGF